MTEDQAQTLYRKDTHSTLFDEDGQILARGLVGTNGTSWRAAENRASLWFCPSNNTAPSFLMHLIKSSKVIEINGLGRFRVTAHECTSQVAAHIHLLTDASPRSQTMDPE